MTKPKPSPLAESGLIVGSIGRGYGYLRRAVARYQSALLSELAERGIVPDVLILGGLQTAMRWELAALASTKLARDPGLAPLERAALVKQIAQCSTERDKALRALGLDGSRKSGIDRMYAKLRAQSEARARAAPIIDATPKQEAAS